MTRFLKCMLLVSLLAINTIVLADSKQDDKKSNAQATFVSQQKDLSVEEAAAFFATIADRLKHEYVEDLTHRQLLEGALGGMLSSLDPHSIYLNPEKYKEIKSQAEGQFGGLGIEITMEDGILKVISPMDDTPAYKAGIKSGDYIVAVDDKPVFGMTIYEAVKKLRGDPSSKVKLNIRRGNDIIDVTVERAIIKVQPVKHRIEGDIGYLRILTFNEQTTIDLIRAIKTIQKEKGDKLKGFVIDLRNNAGGLLDQAVSVSDVFIKEGPIVSIKNREKKVLAEFKAKGEDLTKGVPLVVLVNGGSASASEIVAGALQDHRRALIVGTQTFGKGSVQQITPVRDIGAIKVTIAFYYTPNGRTIQKQGISPEIIIEQQLDLQTINSDKRLREAFLQDALEEGGKRKAEEQLKESKEDKEIKAAIKEKTFKELPDYQLEQAFNILRAISYDQQLLSQSSK